MRPITCYERRENVSYADYEFGSGIDERKLQQMVEGEERERERERGELNRNTKNTPQLVRRAREKVMVSLSLSVSKKNVTDELNQEREKKRSRE